MHREDMKLDRSMRLSFQNIKGERKEKEQIGEDQTLDGEGERRLMREKKFLDSYYP